MIEPQDSTKVTWGQVYNDVKGALDGVADALKTGAEHVYEVLVRQQFTNSVTNIAIYILLASVCYTALRIGQQRYKARDKQTAQSYLDNPTDYADVIIPLIIGVILLGGFVAFLVTTINATITGFINPEYGALQEIKSFIK